MPVYCYGQTWYMYQIYIIIVYGGLIRLAFVTKSPSVNNTRRAKPKFEVETLLALEIGIDIDIDRYRYTATTHNHKN